MAELEENTIIINPEEHYKKTRRSLLYKHLQKKANITYVDRNAVSYFGKMAADEDAKNKRSMDSTVLQKLGGPYDKEIKEGYVTTYNNIIQKGGRKIRSKKTPRLNRNKHATIRISRNHRSKSAKSGRN